MISYFFDENTVFTFLPRGLISRDLRAEQDLESPLGANGYIYALHSCFPSNNL